MRIRSYLHERWLVYCALLTVIGFAWLVYRLELGLYLTESNAAYIGAGWALILLFFAVFDYCSLRARLNKLVNYIENNPHSDSVHFSYPVDQVLADSVRGLAGEFADLKSEISAKAAEQLDFVTKWLHDVKSPITAARLILGELEGHGEHETECNHQLDQELVAIEEAVAKVFFMIKSASFHEDYKITRASTRRLIAAALKGYSHAVSYKKLNLVIRGKDCQVLTDSKWSSYILTQLVSNAVKYTPVGGKITIDTENAPNQVTISVINTGKGILPQDLGQVFNRGYTASEERAGANSTGYGLFLAKKLADLLGHGLTVESKYGEYAAFRLTFYENATLHDVIYKV